MPLGPFIELIGLVVALSGLLLTTRRDASASASWGNLSLAGRLVLCLLVILSGIKLAKGRQDAREAAARKNALQGQLAKLRDDNRSLIKVASVSTGYSALIQGVIVFSMPVSDSEARDALNNMFLKYAQIEITASNKFGVHRGRVDYGAHPEVRRFLNLSRPLTDPALQRYRSQVSPSELGRSHFFEIRCANFRILNNDKIQYVPFGGETPLVATATVFPQWSDFRQLYRVESLYLDQVVIEDLDTVRIGRRM